MIPVACHRIEVRRDWLPAFYKIWRVVCSRAHVMLLISEPLLKAAGTVSCCHSPHKEQRSDQYKLVYRSLEASSVHFPYS
jgi:hypothetical protein